MPSLESPLELVYRSAILACDEENERQLGVELLLEMHRKQMEAPCLLWGLATLGVVEPRQFKL